MHNIFVIETTKNWKHFFISRCTLIIMMIIIIIMTTMMAKTMTSIMMQMFEQLAGHDLDT